MLSIHSVLFRFSHGVLPYHVNSHEDYAAVLLQVFYWSLFSLLFSLHITNHASKHSRVHASRPPAFSLFTICCVLFPSTFSLFLISPLSLFPAIPTTQQNVETHSRKHFGILLFEEANDSYWTRFKQWVGLSTMVRAPQYRQSIFGARARHPAMLAAVQQITERMFAVSAGQQHPNMHFSYEEDRVRFTLELTGPGLFTDVCAAYVSDRGEHGARVITLDHVTEYFMHVHSGTWYEGGEGGWWDEVARLSGVFWLIVFCLLAIVVYTLRWIMGKFAGGVSLVSLWKHGYRAD